MPNRFTQSRKATKRLRPFFGAQRHSNIDCAFGAGELPAPRCVFVPLCETLSCEASAAATQKGMRPPLCLGTRGEYSGRRG